MPATVLLLTPPFTQLNTPYPATAYLKGFLSTRDIKAAQADLGIEVTLDLFSEKGLAQVFEQVAAFKATSALSQNAVRMLCLRDAYLSTIEPVVLFLQGKNAALAHALSSRRLLPEASRFAQTESLHHAFGNMGIQDKAKHLATLYLEDLADLIKECVDEHFGFSRYAERLARSAGSFDELYETLQSPYTLIDELLIKCLAQHVTAVKPALVALSVPFPGNLFAALRCGQWLRKHHPEIKIAVGGGFPNTELRSLSDARVFEFLDFITLDDGEAPLEQLVYFLDGKIAETQLKRTFLLKDGQVTFINDVTAKDYRQGEVGTPDYEGLLSSNYIAAIEVTNPMHALWTDGFWNKLTMAHGCYWGKCTFCDVSLDYIARYEPLTAGVLADRMETIMAQTGVSGFHFVDEAAPPALMRALSLEIIRRGLAVTWWANIRFEKAFTRDLCQLLKGAGCIAVSGGLEVASDRLLALIQKGITVAQVARVTKHFQQAGIMVHAYLMYGFPTQTAQETIDSLEMVRQLFKAGVLQSAFWHQFAMTAHSPVGLEPAAYSVVKVSVPGIFANNDVMHSDPTGADHDSFSYGLKKSLLNWMNGAFLDAPLQHWFEALKVPKTKVAPDYITTALEDELQSAAPNAKVIFAGSQPELSIITKSKKGAHWEVAQLTFQTRREPVTVSLKPEEGNWLKALLEEASVHQPRAMTMREVQDSYAAAGLEDFELFWWNKPVNGLWKVGLLMV